MPSESIGVPPKGFAITPSDTTDLPALVREIFVGTGGDVNVVYAQNTEPLVHKNLPSGSTLSGVFKRVYNDGTTASDLIGRV